MPRFILKKQGLQNEVPEKRDYRLLACQTRLG
jgi:hypothetical protein